MQVCSVEYDNRHRRVWWQRSQTSSNNVPKDFLPILLLERAVIINFNVFTFAAAIAGFLEKKVARTNTALVHSSVVGSLALLIPNVIRRFPGDQSQRHTQMRMGLVKWGFLLFLLHYPGNGWSLWPTFAKCCVNGYSEITTEHVTPSQPVTYLTTTTPETTTSSGYVTPSRCFNLMSALFVCLRFNTNKRCIVFSDLHTGTTARVRTPQRMSDVHTRYIPGAAAPDPEGRSRWGQLRLSEQSVRKEADRCLSRFQTRLERVECVWINHMLI